MRRLISVLVGAIAVTAALSAPATALAADPPPPPHTHGGIEPLVNMVQAPFNYLGGNPLDRPSQ
ncbi:hypothetical protein AB0C93_14470 [Streptomyces sp. NPDC048518]|uniref:hypothetical protein n=1 Tax=Streptomyces sp. NPDC048518 TaxID=3155029 RepID=UPI0034050CD2